MATTAPTTNPPDLQPTTSAAAHARRLSLEKHLQTRPAPADLVERNILHTSPAVASSLHSPTHDLQRAQASDNLKKGLEHRPGRGELVGRNILPEGAGEVASGLEGKRKELGWGMRRDSLEKRLKERKEREELIRGGILVEGGESAVVEEEEEVGEGNKAA